MQHLFFGSGLPSSEYGRVTLWAMWTLAACVAFGDVSYRIAWGYAYNNDTAMMVAVAAMFALPLCFMRNSTLGVKGSLAISIFGFIAFGSINFLDQDINMRIFATFLAFIGTTRRLSTAFDLARRRTMFLPRR